MNFIFTCPLCHGHRMEEVLADVCVRTEFYFDDAGNLQYCENAREGGHVERYQCADCGWLILDDSSKYQSFTQDGLGEDALRLRLTSLIPPK